MPNLPVSVQHHCLTRGLGEVIRTQPLKGGIISEVARLFTSSGATLVLKQSNRLAADTYAKEAAGLAALDRPGCPRVPKVLDVSATHLLLEDLGSHVPTTQWQLDFALQLATLHTHTADAFGWHEDNYLGHLPQINTRHEDGVAFFIERRILRYVNDPILDVFLDANNRRAVERFCRRFEREVPKIKPALLHGDLWIANALADEHGKPAFVDPAVYYGLAESELSFTRMFGGFDEPFFEAYVHHHPLPDGWRERLPLYDIREWLGILANAGNLDGCLDELRLMLRR